MMITQGYPLMIETATREKLLVVGWWENDGDLLPIVLSPMDVEARPRRLPAHQPFTVHSWGAGVVV